MTPPPALPTPGDPSAKLASRIAIISVGSAMFMQFVDSTALSTAVPTLARAFDVDPVDIRLVLTTYIVVQALFLPASGWVADRFGARRVFMVAMSVFVLGSVLSGLSQTLPQLVGARIVQGLGGAMMAPIGRIIVVGASPRDQLVRAMMWLSLPAATGPLLGPPLAGLILSVGTWPWIFFINVPIGIAALVAVARVVPQIDRPHPGPFDGLGFMYSSLVIGALMLVVEAAGHDVRLQIGAALVAIPAGFAFFWHARRRLSTGRRPVLDLSLLRFRTYRNTMIGGSLLRLAMGGSPYLLALLMQVGLGWSALQAGLVTIAAAVGSLGARPFGPWLIGKFGFRWMLIGSALIVALLGAAPALFRDSTPIWLIMAILVLTGYARASQFTSVNALSYADVPEERVSGAATLSAVMQQITLSLGISVAALSLHFGDLLNPGPLHLSDFAVSFGLISVFALLAVPIYAALPHNAGAEMSGQKLRD